jgi:hypothetical protein
MPHVNTLAERANVVADYAKLAVMSVGSIMSAFGKVQRFTWRPQWDRLPPLRIFKIVRLQHRTGDT